MEDNKYLTLARQARADGNSEDAKTYYNKVREDDPENGEAKFFYAYFALYEGKNGEIPQRFGNVCQAVFSAVKMVKSSTAPVAEQYATISEIVNAFLPMTWTLNRYMNNKNRETKVGDSYVKVFDQSSITSSCKKGMFAIRDLGNELESIYGGDADAMAIAVLAWKEYVSLAQKWYAYPPKGEAEIYAEKIKKIEPSYEMPKKAGCISFSDKKN
ncbi:MAG: hypothetical protein IKJ24_01605 [Clostridia bacterium]|nr:hypothetical protein [Clostridia bacterium]